jgi:fumarate reductase flavoprotein subunit
MRKRKALATLAAGTLAVTTAAAALTGCGSSNSASATTQAATEATENAASAEAIYTEGTYTSSADGFGGKVTVTMTFSDTEILEVIAEGPDETQGVGTNAIEQLPDLIKEAQSADIDGISGCTVSSTALLAAAKDCIAQAMGTSGEGGYTAGTYTEKVSGRNAAITVEVVLSDSAIESVTVVDQSETASVAGVALERIPAAIVENQTTKVDGVTGATVTSNAIKQAVNNAITEAGGNTASLPEAYAEAGEDIEETADIIVVGGGGAGMSAAETALESGASVILVEKTSMLGGNTVLCGGALNAADTEWAAEFDAQTGETDTLKALISLDESEIAPEYLDDFHTLQGQVEEYLAGDTTKHFDSVELHTIQTYYNGMRKDLDGNTIYGNYDLVSEMTKNAMDTVAWLAEEGVQWQEAVTQPVGAMWRRGHNPSMLHGEEYVAVFEKNITSRGGEIMYETAAETLLTDADGRVNGVTATKADGTKVTLHANKAVVLATGGYANNLKLVQETNNYWPSIPDDTGTTNASGMTGDGIVMAQAVGADTTGMEFTQLMAVSDPDTGDLFTGLLPRSTADYIFVNSEGKRFINECAARDTLAIAAFDNGSTFYMIADIDIAEDARWLTDWEVEVERGNAIQADTLEELADKLGFDESTKATFLETIENYNSYVDQGSDPDFDKTAFNMKVEKAPFFATPRKPALHHTMGGVVIDTGAHVLDTDGNAIAGLYAAGEVAGGIHAGNRLGGNAVADCFVFGRIAGQNAANE